MVATMIERPAPPGGPPPRLRRRRRGAGAVAAIALVLLTLVVAGAARNVLPSLRNPFATDTVDRSQPALLRALEDLSQYRASTAHFELVLDVEDDARYLPAFLKGERTVFVAAGTVDAYVDFSALGPGAVEVSPDRRAVSIRLPRAQLSEPRVDVERSYVAVRDRGLLDRFGSVFSDNPTGERQLFLLAEKKMERAARDSGAAEAAERNTEQMLSGLVRSLGFTELVVEFQPPAEHR